MRTFIRRPALFLLVFALGSLPWASPLKASEDKVRAILNQNLDRCPLLKPEVDADGFPKLIDLTLNTAATTVTIAKVRYSGFRFKVDRKEDEAWIWAFKLVGPLHWHLNFEANNGAITFHEWKPTNWVSQAIAGGRLTTGKIYDIWFEFKNATPAKCTLTFRFTEAQPDEKGEVSDLELLSELGITTSGAVLFDYQGHNGRATQKWASGDLPGAIKHFDESIRLAPKNAYPYDARGLVKKAKGDFEGAIADFTRAIQLEPKDSTGYDHRADARASKGDPRGAIADYSKAIDLDPKDTYAYTGRGLTRQAGDVEGALADYDKAIQFDPKRVIAYLLRGEIRSKKGDPAGALADFGKVIELEPENAGAYTDRGALRLNTGDQDGAIVDATKAIELDPKNAIAYGNRGLAKRHRHEFEGSLADFTKAIELAPKNAFSYSNRGCVRGSMADYEGALADHKQAIELEPKNVFLYQNRALTKNVMGDEEGAIADCTKAIELDPKNYAGYVERALSFATQGKWMKAYGDFDAALRMNVKNFYPAFYRWVAQTRLGQSPAANKELQAAADQRWDAKPGDWPSKLTEFLLGKIDEAALLGASDGADESTTRGQRCEGWYFSGVVRLAAGQSEDAASCFRKSLATKLGSYYEYRLAETDLARLEKK